MSTDLPNALGAHLLAARAGAGSQVQVRGYGAVHERQHPVRPRGHLRVVGDHHQGVPLAVHARQQVQDLLG